jgi:hypothetical protein
MGFAALRITGYGPFAVFDHRRDFRSEDLERIALTLTHPLIPAQAGIQATLGPRLRGDERNDSTRPKHALIRSNRLPSFGTDERRTDGAHFFNQSLAKFRKSRREH